MDAAPFDNFGFSVTLDADTALVGSIFDDHPGGINAGAAYVYFRAGGSWSQQVKLTASDAASSDSFGRSVALSGNLAVVGAYQDDHVGGANAGSAYVFLRSETSWTQQGKLIASDAAPSDFFGSAVAIDGTAVAVGAPSDDRAAVNDAGSTYVVEISCLPSADIPATSAWGLAITGLALASVGTVILSPKKG